MEYNGWKINKTDSSHSYLHIQTKTFGFFFFTFTPKSFEMEFDRI